MSALAAAAALAAAVAGCSFNDKLAQSGSAVETLYYVQKVDELEFADADAEIDRTLARPASQTTNAVLPLERKRPLKLTQSVAIRYALEHSRIIRQDAQFLSPGNLLLNNPEATASMLDPAIQQSSILIGNRGLEAAQSDFSPQFSTSMIWGRDERIQNNIFTSGVVPGRTLTDETGQFSMRLEKLLGTGGSLAVNHDVNYSGQNAATRLFPSVYTGDLSFELSQPLLAGAGTEFTHIAGPASRLSPREPTVAQGVWIARINRNVSQLNLEVNVRQLVQDVSQVYWDLYFAHRRYEAEVKARDAAEKLWKTEQAELESGRGTVPREAEAADNFYFRRSAVEQALADLNRTEVRLRRLMNLNMDDAMFIEPIDEPQILDRQPSWSIALTEALDRRVELRRTKQQVRSLEFQLRAARSLNRPTLDLVAEYRVNGFGDQLFSRSDNDGITAQGLRSFNNTLAQGSQTGWNLGLIMATPLGGNRLQKAQVDNLELRLAKSHAVLAAQELEVAAEVSDALNAIQRWQQVSESNHRRRQASQRRVDAHDAEIEEGRPVEVFDILRARNSYAQAEIEYYRSVAEYMKTQEELHFRTGTLLQRHCVFLPTTHGPPGFSG